MRSALSHKFADTVVPFLKFCGWSALTIGAGAAVSNTPTLLNDVLTDQAIEGLKSFSVVLGAASGFAGNRVGDYYKECREKLKLSINGDLEKALKKALLRTTDTVCDQYIQTKKIVGDQEVLVRQFFKELKGQLDAVVVEDHHIEEYAKNRDFFLHIFTQGRGFSGLDSDEDLVRFLTQEFPKEVTHAFLKELKGNPKAQIVYHTLLLEMSVQQGQLSNETLQALQADLLRLADNSENVQGQMHRIYHLLQLIQQALVKQNIDLSARFRQLENLLKDTSQPSLTDYSQDYKQVDARFQYNYKTGYTTFIARQPELEQVEAFVLPDAGQRFRWWLLTGPGGMGKSRLAQEVCLRFNPYETWYAGFLDKKQLSDFSWHTWLPKHHTLIVVDYVSTRAQDVEYMLTKLHERSSTFDKSVRVLLLERDTNGSWWDTLQKSMGASKSQYAEPLALSPFTDDDRWQIIEEVHRKVTDEHRRIGKPLPDKLRDRVQTLEKLAELDPKNRPLFAFFVGMALAAGKTIRDWDVNQLLEYILDEHERKRWRESTDELLLQKHERLLALATITRGLTSAHWRTLQKIKDPVLPDTLDRNLYHRMAGVADSAGDKQYLPLEPDILGEFLVKQTFEALQNDDNYDPNTVQKLIWLAWQFRPDETWAFAERLLGDFPKTTFCSCFWASLPSDLWTTLPADRSLEIALDWSRFQVNLTHSTYAFVHNSLNDLLNKYNQIGQLRQQPGLSDNVELTVLQASAAFNLTGRLGAHKEHLGRAQTYYQKIVELRQQPGLSGNVELAVRQASAATNLTSRLGSHKEHLSLAQTYYQKIVELRQQPGLSDNVELAILQASAAMNLTSDLGAHKEHLSLAQTYYQKIVELHQQPGLSDNVELAVLQAKAATNLTSRLGSHKEHLSLAQTYYQKIVELRQQPGLSGNVELAVKQASAAFNLTSHLGSHKEHLELAQDYYQKIVELRQQPGLSDNVELAVEQASAATNLTGRLGSHKEHLELAQTYYDRIGVLASEFKTLDILQALSRATRVLFKHYITYLRTGAVDQASTFEQINELFGQSSHLNDIGKEIDAPYLQIEFGIVVFTLLNEPIANYSPEQVQAWHQILYYLLQNFADYPDESWQNYWQPELLRYFQWLSDSASKPEETDESSTDK